MDCILSDLNAMSTQRTWLSVNFLRFFGRRALLRGAGEVTGPCSPVPQKALEGSSAPPAVFVEQRRAPRRWGNPIQVQVRDGLPSTKPMQGWVMNRSAGGLGLSVAQPVTAGTFLSVRVALASESIPWVVVEVKACQPLAGRWLLCCQFVQAPPAEVLLLFR
jgi:hypothetical protein